MIVLKIIEYKVPTLGNIGKGSSLNDLFYLKREDPLAKHYVLLQLTTGIVRTLLCLRSVAALYCSQYGSRSDCSLKRSLIRAKSASIHDKISLECI